MSEYLLNVWGGFFNEGNQVRHGKRPGYYWFNSPDEREAFVNDLMEIEERLDAHYLATRYYDGPLVRKRTIARGSLTYGSTIFNFEYDFGYGYDPEVARYAFTDGDYSCDCNRSLLIQKAEPDFRELPCGGEIGMFDFEIVYREGSGNQYEEEKGAK